MRFVLLLYDYLDCAEELVFVPTGFLKGDAFL